MGTPTQTPTRNTLIQRASRARRKSYIGDLERRVREYETLGVRATEHVQAAARKVAEENRQLREEVIRLRERNEALERGLAGRGRAGADAMSLEDEVRGVVPEKTVAQHYPSPPQRQDHEAFRVSTSPPGSTTMVHRTPSTSASTSTFPIRPTSERPYEENPHCDMDSASRLAVEERECMSRETPSPRPPPITPWLPHPSSASTYNLEHGYNNEHSPDANTSSSQTSLTTTTAQSPHSPLSTPLPSVFLSECTRLSGGRSTNNSTSCAEAALIIASMRGLAPTDSTVESEILAQLGCHTATTPCIHTHTDTEPSLRTRLLGGHPSEHRNGYQCRVQDAQSCVVDNRLLFGILDADGVAGP